MRKVNVLQILLESVVILGCLVVGVTVLTYLIQRVGVDRIYLGIITLAVGTIGLTNFFTLKFVNKLKSIQSLVMSLAFVALGIIFIVSQVDIKTICLVGGIVAAAYLVCMIITAILNITSQPLLHGIEILIALVGIVFSIILVFKTIDFLYKYLIFVGVALSLEALILLIEFIIHRYQK